MNKLLSLVTFIICFGFTVEHKEFIERQGQVTFFSYTSVENIQATNNQVLSLFNPTTSEIAVSILMRAFVFKKSLMHEHFNESYIESDLYPKATFNGSIIDFDPDQKETQTRIIKGDFTLKDRTKPIEIKAKITRTDIGYTIEGSLDVLIDDYSINVPSLLSPNISKKIEVSFNFNYAPYEE
ncbi:YceI family protein [Aquimarina sp. RZ0]|uniref:YceI family protein n=1 Tax=Aquimarina sp. RZ0 TaxID=2607730 RepID=UPI0011F3AC59|nr:YceI family protein [Aquimarina sp. RZ0]KAA1247191.1 YceI family protein [Aquimarina sp. RZ0]